MRMVDVLKDTFIMLIPMLAVLALVILWPDLVLSAEAGVARVPAVTAAGFRCAAIA